MIHYNPTEHHDELMKHIAAAVLSHTELDTPQMPMLNNGTQCWALRTEENTYLFTDMELWTQLIQDSNVFLSQWLEEHPEVLAEIPKWSLPKCQ